jgi:hypothetical protein
MTTATYPRVSPCRHCGLAVLRDNDGVWIHASLSYVCRDRAGNARPGYAAPEAPAAPIRPAGTAPDHRSRSPVAGYGSATV